MSEKPGQNEIFKSSEIRWLDEDPQIMKKIPSEEERIIRFDVSRLIHTLLRLELIIIGAVPVLLFFGGSTHGWRQGSTPIIEVNWAWKIGSLIFFFAMIGLINFLGRKEKGHVDVYSGMLVFYDYDQFSKKARPSHFFYWKDIVQYHRKENYFWVHAKANIPERTWVPMRKLLPYFRQYAPHAKEVSFNMENYWRCDSKENQTRNKSPEEIAIEKEMAANREKAKEVLAGAKDVTAMMEEVEAKRQQEEAAARQKTKDFWNNYPEE